MNLQETYKELIFKIKEGNYKKIIVSGPQRSGTTYLASILSEDLNYTHIDEREFENKNEYKFYNFLSQENVVIQAPNLSQILHEIESENTLILFMYRNNEDIFKSEERIGWHPKFTNLVFEYYLNKFESEKEYILSFDRSSPMKKWIWENIQQNKMKCDFLNVSYDIVKQTRGYVEPDLRKKFDRKQISIDNDI